MVLTCTDTVEIRYLLGKDLVALAVTDLGSKAASAVYTYYDPALARRSLGTFSILFQLALARKRGMEHLYLGLYVEGCSTTSYKARISDHQRLVGGTWRDFPRQT